MEKKRVVFVGKKLPYDIERNKLYDLIIVEEFSKKMAIVCRRARSKDKEESVTKVEYKPEEWNVVVKVNLQLSITDEDIDDIMVGALEGGINYWCDDAKPVGDYLGNYASEQISRGGSLKLHDIEEEKDYLLTREAFIDGIVKYLENPHPYDITDRGYGTYIKIDAGKCDAVVCDMIIQYAIFGEVVYG